ncbi:MAG: hypothetical protein P1P90_01470 [Patescibacteria group bacterium]|nr:hypothetical protein [Patescibacteria group bacterium]
MSIGEQVGKIVRKVDRKLNIPPGVDGDLYRNVQKIAGDKYEPRLIGKGGEHLVFKFEDPKHPNTVYKVNTHATAALYRSHLLGPNSEADARANLDRQILRRNHRTRELRDYFGFRSVPVQKYMIRDVPINLDIVARLAPNLPVDPAHLPETIPAWVTVQRKIELPEDSTTSLDGYYPELRIDADKEKQREFYIKSNELLLNGNEHDMDIEQQKEMVCALYDTLTPTYLRAELDPDYKSKLQETARKLIRYTTETENTLDMAGKDNLVLTREKDGWQLQMLDPLSNTDFTLTDIREAIQKLDDDKQLTHDQLVRSINTLNTIRVINSLAILADIPERLRVIADPNEITIDLDTDESDIDISFEDPDTGTLTPATKPNNTPSKPHYLEIPVLPFLNSLKKLQKR